MTKFKEQLILAVIAGLFALAAAVISSIVSSRETFPPRSIEISNVNTNINNVGNEPQKENQP